MSVIIVVVAKYFILIPVLLTLLLAWKQKSAKKRVRYILFVAATGALAYSVASIVGSFVIDPRPFVVSHFTPLIAHAADNGFPSDHALFAASLAFAGLVFSKRYGIVMLIIGALIGASRVAAGVHHWEDIIGSFTISAISALAIFGLSKLIAYESKDAQK